PAANPRKSVVGLVYINAAIIGEASGLILMNRLGHAWAALWYGSVLVLGASIAYLGYGWRIYAVVEGPGRCLKFLCTAYLWLFISLALLVLYPAYQLLLPRFAPESLAAQIGFSHAYYGATRHAITVGFISLMIVGVAAKVVPTLNGVDVRALPALWAPFVLINAGCALRVVGQTLTDFSAAAFPFAGVSGVLEVTGLAVWGVHVWRIMGGWRPAAAEPVAVAPAPDGRLAAEDTVGYVLDRHPELLPTFLRFGFTPLMNDALRRALARRVTLAQA